MASICKGKESWPELLGVNGNEAAVVIERENTNVKAVVKLDVVKLVNPVHEDFLCDRVWVWVDENGAVVKVPKIG